MKDPVLICVRRASGLLSLLTTVLFARGAHPLTFGRELVGSGTIRLAAKVFSAITPDLTGVNTVGYGGQVTILVLTRRLPRDRHARNPGLTFR